MTYAAFGTTQLDPRIAQAQSPLPDEPTIGGELSKGVSRGLRNAGGQLRQIAGLTGEALGADDFARGQYAGAKTLREAGAAPEFAASNPTWDGVHGVGGGLRFAAGQVGEMAPMMAGAVGTGLATGNPILGGAAFMAPFEAGDVAQRQQEDPQAAAEGAGTRLGKAALGGAASSLAMNALPAGLSGQIGGKLAEGAATQLAKKSVTRAVADNVAHGAAVNAAGMGASDVAKQYAVNQDKPTDWSQVGDSALAGGVGGAAFGTAGAAADLARGRAGAVGDALGSARTSINDRLAAAKDSAAGAVDTATATPAAKKVGSVFDSMSELVQKGKAAAGNLVDKVLKGEEIGVDPADLAAATPERQQAMFDFSDNEKLKAASQWGKDMLDKMSVDDPKRQAVADAMGKVSTDAGQIAMAGLKKTWDLGKAAGAKIDDFTSAVRQGREDALAPTDSAPVDTAKPTIAERKTFMDARIAEGMTKVDASKAFEDSLAPKKSEDYSGTQQVILGALQDSGIAKSRPELFSDPAKTNELASSLRVLLDQMAQGPIHPDVMHRLTGVLGDDTAGVVNSLKRALGTELAPHEAESYFKNLNEITAVQQRNSGLHEQLRGFMTPESQGMSGYDLMHLGDNLVEHARGNWANKDEKPTAAGTAADNMARTAYQHYFGDKADAATKAVQKHAELKLKAEGDVAPSHLDEHGNMVEGDKATFDEQGSRVSPEALETMKFGLTEPDAKGNSKSKLNGEPMAADSRYAKQHLEDLKAKYPQHDVRFEKEKGSDLGHIVVEKQADPDALTTADVEGMKLSKDHPGSKDKITVGGMALDTKRIAKAMDGRLEYSAGDEVGRAHRIARMFMEGIARLQEMHGAFEVPDHAVVGKVGGKDLTFGEAKKLDKRTEADKASDKDNQDLTAMRGAYKKTTDEGSRAAMRERAAEITKDQEKAKDTELGGGHDNREARPEDGSRGAPKDAEIHAAAADNKPADLIVKNNVDGSPRFTNDRANLREALDGAANELKAKTSKAQQALGDKLKALVTTDVQVRMTDKDQAQLARVLTLKLPSERAAIINPLMEKYATEKIASKPDNTGAGDLLSKNIAKRQEYLNDPPADYSTEVAKGHLDWAAKQLERVDAERAKVEATSDRGEQLGDYASSLKTLTKKAKSVLEGDASLAGFEGSAPSPKELAAKKAAFLERAASGDKALLKELSTSTDAKGLQRAAEALPAGHALDVVNAQLSELVQDPDTAYGLATKKYSLEGADKGRGARMAATQHVDDLAGRLSRKQEDADIEWQKVRNLEAKVAAGKATKELLDGIREQAEYLQSLADKVKPELEAAKKELDKYSAESTDPARDNSKSSGQDIKDHITKVLGNTVKTAWATFTHAGEYSHAQGQGIIRLSVHALDPMSTAFHESFHAFAAQLRDAGAHDVVGVMEKAAASEHVIAQLAERFKGQPEVLKQLKDPEERAAYMYQMWAADPTGFKVSIAARNVFQKIGDMIRKVMGVWTNDERALHIMKYFNEGQYAQNLGHPSVVRRALMEGEGRNKVYETAKALAEPLAKLSDAVMGTGSARLRDTGIPALNQLADLIKRDATKVGGDQGYIQAARVEATKRLGALGDSLAAYTPDQLQDAMESLQKGSVAATAEGQAAAASIKGVLAETKAYMKAAGVDMGDLGKDYFPRVWDTHYISKNQAAFRDMLEPYIRRGEMKGTADQLIRNLTNRGGSEFGIETREPGMQFKKERLLSFIDPKDAAEFVAKDLMGTLSSYVNQATRKAEWSRRLGGGKLEGLFEKAKQQGATKEHLDLAETYLKGVDGTLGDDLNPHARRIMGNMLVYQNIRLLPTAAFSMLIDPNGVMVRGGTLSDAWKTFKRGISEIPETYGKTAKPDEATRLAELTGVIDSAIMSHTMGDLYTQGMVGGTAKSLNNAFFKYNMVEGLNRSFRVGASEAAMSFLARHADGTRNAHSARFMKELGIQTGDIVPTKDGRVALTEGEGLSAEQVNRVHAAINQWVDGAVLRPDAADKPIWMNDPRFALVSHLKQFVFAFQETILKRTIHEFKHGNYTPAMALASYVPVMLAADLAKGALVSGGGQPEWQKGWDMADYLGYASQRAGLLGVGQFGLDVAKDIHRGGLGIGALSGPTAEQFGDTVSALGGHKQFGSVVLHAMPANALYAHQFGDAQADPMQAE